MPAPDELLSLLEINSLATNIFLKIDCKRAVMEELFFYQNIIAIKKGIGLYL
jgi:hypothetical protein